MKYILLPILAAFTLVFAGCQSLDTLNANTPHLNLQGTINGQPFSLSNPKDTILDGLDISVATNGTANIHIDHLSTTENPTNIVNTGTAEANVVTATGNAIVNALQVAGAAAIQGASAAAK